MGNRGRRSRGNRAVREAKRNAERGNGEVSGNGKGEYGKRG